MELGEDELQFLLSLLTIMGVAALALICDFMRRRNQQVRELTPRREEEQPHPRIVAAPPMSSAIPRPKAVAAPKHRERAIAPEALAAMERGAQMAGTSPPTVLLLPKRDWNALLSRRSPMRQPPRPVEVRRPESNLVPAGFHDGSALKRLGHPWQRVTGLVVSIGVDSQDGSIPEPVRKLVESLLGPGDFACKSGSSEFLLIYPNLRGAAAQRRLCLVAQSLWDFQLRWLANFSILFSWGGVEVRGESIKEAIAAATERMLETKRGRKVESFRSKPVGAARAQAV